MIRTGRLAEIFQVTGVAGRRQAGILPALVAVVALASRMSPRQRELRAVVVEQSRRPGR